MCPFTTINYPHLQKNIGSVIFNASPQQLRKDFFGKCTLSSHNLLDCLIFTKSMATYKERKTLYIVGPNYHIFRQNEACCVACLPLHVSSHCNAEIKTLSRKTINNYLTTSCN
jgi:hypothetical protein